MEKHNRRVAALHFSKLMMEGRSTARDESAAAVGGCCSPYAFETALDLLEIEVGNSLMAHTHAHTHLAPTSSPPTDHLLTTYRPSTDRLLSTSSPPTGHLRTAYCPPPHHLLTMY
jgi:hypothetical protein